MQKDWFFSPLATHLGHSLVLIGFGAVLLSILLYALARTPKLLKAARAFFFLSAAATLGVQAWLITLLMTRQYQFEYVHRVTDNTLSTPFRLTGAWAAQEGSFLLWAFFTAMLGVIAIRSLKRFERAFMAVYGGILASVLGILAFQSPFILLYEKVKAQALAAGDTVTPAMEQMMRLRPLDGRGMNPSLENYWMAIHPPIIFIGFASLGILFAYGAAALLMREYNEWAQKARPWCAFTVAVLGFGIVLGGFWAYETQGWGGFWAWDPVENVSFLPWLGSAALLHGLYTQSSRSRMRWFNLFLAGLPFLLFAYGTFITRSGALADMSVHAFAADLKSGALLILLWLCRFFTTAYVGLALLRLKDVKRISAPVEPARSLLSRETAFNVGVMMLILAVVFVAAGTFLPLILQQWLHRVPTKVSLLFYLACGALVTLPMAVYMALGPHLSWKKTSGEALLERVYLPWLLTVAFTCVSFFTWFVRAEPGTPWLQKVGNAIPLLVSAILFFAVVSNLMLLWRNWKAGAGKRGAYLSHIGVAMLLLGLVISKSGERKEVFTLARDFPVQRGDTVYTFQGMSSNVEIKTNRVMIKVAQKGKPERIATPRFYLSMKQTDQNGNPMAVRWPSIRRGIMGDQYLSLSANPQQLENPWNDNVHPISEHLKRGETKQMGPYKVKFLEFETQGQMGQPGFQAGALFEVTFEGKTEQVVPILAVDNRGDLQPGPARLMGDALAIIEFNIAPGASERSVGLMLFAVPGHPETFFKPVDKLNWVVEMEAFHKPMTGLVWIGAVVMLMGGLISSRYRALENRALASRQNAESKPLPVDEPERENALV